MGGDTAVKNGLRQDPKKKKRCGMLILKIISNILCVLIICVFLLCLYLFFMRTVVKDPYPTVLGYGHAVVITGSMEPDIQINDLVITKKKETLAYQIGDTVIFFEPSVSRPVTHKIIDREGNTVTTKGTANNVADKPIDASEIQGEVIKIIPEAGAVFNFLKSPVGIFMLVAAGLLIYFIPITIGKYREHRHANGEA